jgi:tRNA threonylcarbamoyladenosine biosynthesis protein TsaB
LDTATEMGGVALLEDNVLQAQAQIRVIKTHAGQIWETIAFLLDQAGWELRDIDLWAVTVGPGSFTGLRIGLATIKGLALATEKPMIGLSTLEVLASSFAYSPHLICPVVDARKKEVFAAFFRPAGDGKVTMSGSPRNIKPMILVKEIKEPVLLVGNGACQYAALFKDGLGPWALFPEPHLHLLSPFSLGVMAWTRFQQGARSAPEEISPLYIRPSDAELKISAPSA